MTASPSESLPNVIPFGDVTEAENAATAELFGLTPQEAYAAGQLPIGEVDAGDMDIAVNPAGLVKKPRERYWIPAGRLAVAIAPLADAATAAANAKSLAEVRKTLERMRRELVREAAKVTPEMWQAMEEKRIRVIRQVSAQQGSTPRPESLQVKPMRDIARQSSYWKPLERMIEWLHDPVGRKPPFPIFTEGSSKLPFFQWSTVPGLTCPGAGKCWDSRPEQVQRRPDGTLFRDVSTIPHKAYCYSLNGWRHVYPFLRQLQNTILTRLPDKSWIELGLREMERRNPEAVVRLFVDGDFDSLETLEYWMHVCERFPRMRFYGYSKSWHLFQQWDRKHGGKWPVNYMLNLSNGTMWESVGGEIYRQMLDRMLALKCVRGRFIAIPSKLEGRTLIASKMPAYTERMAREERDPRDTPGWREHVEEVKRAAESLGIERPFVCPGKCFACLGPKSAEAKEELKQQGKYGRHACGDSVMQGRNIVIAVH
jgi:hypothetical protein